MENQVKESTYSGHPPTAAGRRITNGDSGQLGYVYSDRYWIKYRLSQLGIKTIR